MTNLHGQRSIRTGQKNNGFPYFGVMRLGQCLEDIEELKLLGKEGSQNSIILIVLNINIEGKLGGCFGEQYQ